MFAVMTFLLFAIVAEKSAISIANAAIILHEHRRLLSVLAAIVKINIYEGTRADQSKVFKVSFQSTRVR